MEWPVSAETSSRRLRRSGPGRIVKAAYSFFCLGSSFSFGTAEAGGGPVPSAACSGVPTRSDDSDTSGRGSAAPLAGKARLSGVRGLFVIASLDTGLRGDIGPEGVDFGGRLAPRLKFRSCPAIRHSPSIIGPIRHMDRGDRPMLAQCDGGLGGELHPWLDGVNHEDQPLARSLYQINRGRDRSEVIACERAADSLTQAYSILAFTGRESDKRKK
jgi:hypothetical protein